MTHNTERQTLNENGKSVFCVFFLEKSIKTLAHNSLYIYNTHLPNVTTQHKQQNT